MTSSSDAACFDFINGRALRGGRNVFWLPRNQLERRIEAKELQFRTCGNCQHCSFIGVSMRTRERGFSRSCSLSSNVSTWHQGACRAATLRSVMVLRIAIAVSVQYVSSYSKSHHLILRARKYNSEEFQQRRNK